MELVPNIPTLDVLTLIREEEPKKILKKLKEDLDKNWQGKACTLL